MQQRLIYLIEALVWWIAVATAAIPMAWVIPELGYVPRLLTDKTGVWPIDITSVSRYCFFHYLLWALPGLAVGWFFSRWRDSAIVKSYGGR